MLRQSWMIPTSIPTSFVAKFDTCTASFTAAPSPTITSKDAVAQIVNMAALRSLCSLRRVGALSRQPPTATASTKATASAIARMTNARAITSTRWSANVNYLIRRAGSLRECEGELTTTSCAPSIVDRCPDVILWFNRQASGKTDGCTRWAQSHGSRSSYC
jgi:hypothetical protein